MRTMTQTPSAEALAQSRSVVLDLSRLPLIFTRWPVAGPTELELQQYCDALSEVVLRGEPHVFLADTTGCRLPSPQQVRMLLELQRRVEPHSRCLAQAFVSDSAAMNAVFHSLRWLHLTKQAWCVSPTVPAAEDWLRGYLRF